MLVEAIVDYLCQIKCNKTHKDARNLERFTDVLTGFLIYMLGQEVDWEDMFAFDTFRNFRKATGLKKASHASPVLRSTYMTKARSGHLFRSQTTRLNCPPYTSNTYIISGTPEQCPMVYSRA